MKDYSPSLLAQLRRDKKAKGIRDKAKGKRNKRQGEVTKAEGRILNLVGQTFLSDK